MGPKKKGVKKKIGKKSGSTKGPTIIDGVPVSEMTKDQLEGHVKRLQTELHKEREERNFHQLERDRLTTFWEVGKKQLEECRAEARVKDRELEEADERHQTEIKVYKQKVKHLLYEQEHNLAELKAENMVSLKVAREEYQKIEQLHLHDKRKLQEDLHSKDKQYQNILRNLKLQQGEQMEKMRQEFEERVREIERRYSDRFANLRSELHLKLKSEVSDTEERKNAQIDNIRKKHDKAVNEMKNYYNDITLNNLAMISTLKEEIKVKDERFERNEQLLNSVQQENKKLAEPLKKAKEQLTELQRQIGTQEKEKSALNTARNKLKAREKEVEALKWELEVLRQKYDKTLAERDSIHEKFSTSILELQQKSSLKYLVLEKKLKSMKEELDVKDAQLFGIFDAQIDAKDRDKVLLNTRDVVKEQDERIRRLERDLIMMRQKREWGEYSDQNSRTTSKETSTNDDATSYSESGSSTTISVDSDMDQKSSSR